MGINHSIIQQLEKVFIQEHLKKPLITRSPGRINIIGEHTDYNHGFVLPAAIDKACYVALTESEDQQCTMRALDLDEFFIFSISDSLKPSDIGWANYFLGVVHQFKQRNKALKGFHMIFSSDVPLGAGLSSSAALETAFAFALNEAFECHLDRVELAQIGQAAEHTFAGTKCGIMDQFASCLGRVNHALLIDCQSLVSEYIPCELGDNHMVLFDTGVKHSLVDSEYNTRRKQCEEGVELLQSKYPNIQSLRDATLNQLNDVKEAMNPVVYQRCHYVLNEEKRVIEATQALKNQNIKKLGELMFQTHWGLRDEYEVSCDELDVLVDLAEQHPQIIGARMMGGGFGGCTINIIKKNSLATTIAEILNQFEQRTHQTIKHYEVVIDDGATIVHT